MKKCPHCFKDIKEEANFCGYCGKETVLEKSVLTSSTLEQIMNHLEFLGYKIERRDYKNPGDKMLFIATHPEHYNFTFIPLISQDSNFILFKLILTTDKSKSIEMDAAINRVNTAMFITRAYFQIEKGVAALRFEAVYMGEYVKDIFGKFFTQFGKDQTICFDDAVFSKAFRG